MLIPFDRCIELLNKHNIQIKGVLHIGAHMCEEKDAYTSHGIQDIVWVEGNRTLVEKAKKELGISVYHALIDETEKEVVFHIANNGQSSSLLEFGTHAVNHSHVSYIDSITERTTTLKHFIEANNIHISNLNFWNLDIQGVELRALRSAENYIQYADALYLEVNSEEVYKDCDLIQDMDAFLMKHGFTRVATTFWGTCGWGDALYVRTHP